MHETLRGFYTKLYTSEKHDSPEKSRVSLTQRIKRTLSAGIPRNEVLNIGSGPQSLERQLWKMGDTSLFSRFRFSTVDVATISPKKLLGRNNPNITHTQASALNLPYGDETFGLIVSNHAIDFLPRNSFNEAYRVLAPNGKAIFYFHHPDMIPNDLDRVRNITVKNFWSHLRNNNLLFDSEQRIVDEMEAYGFFVESVKLNSDSRDKWWEVELTNF